MNDHLDNSVKKRSLSNYLSNVNSRREELESLKKKQEGERQKLALLQREHQEEQKIEEDTPVEEQGERQDPVIDEDRPSKPAFEQERVEQSSLVLQTAAQKDATYNLKSLDLNVEDGGRGIPSDKAGVALKVKEEHISTKAQPGISTGEKLETGEHKNEKILRNDLHAMLKEPEVRHKSPGPGDNSEDEETIEKNARKEEESDEDVASDAPTEPASPPRPRRRRLIRGDRLSSLSPRHSTFDNESDSELSDIDELKSIQISSSFIHGDSSPTRDVEESKRRLHHASSPRLIRRSMSPRHAKHHVTVPRASKQKKGVYRDAGGRTRLQISCDKGNYEQAKKLIEDGDYDVNDQDNAGNTALHEAALNGHLDVVRLLIESNADVNTQSFEMFKDTPLIDASANGHLEVVKYLLSHGADPTICNAKGLTAFESIEDIDLDEQEKEIADEIKRCLRSAARNWKDKKNVADIRLKNRHHSEDKPHPKQRSEEPLGEFEFFWTDISSRAGREKLFKASKEGKLSYVGAYLENGGKVDLKSFFEAVKFGHEDIASLFLAFGAHVNAVSKSGTTALICAVGRGHLGTVKLLLEAGADPSKRDKHGRGALHYAENSPMGVINSEEIKLLEHALADASPDEKQRRKVNRTTDVSPDIADEEQETVKKQEGLTELHEGHEDEENIISIARKRRTVSPDRLDRKRQALANETSLTKSPTPEDPDAGNLLALKANETARSEYENVKIHEETPEEKEQRLKAEEEYIQKRLQNKRRKEQELLRKLALDEEKREKEKALQRVEEAEKLRERERLRQIEQSNKNKEVEIARRREIRSLYPIGLRLVNFDDTNDYISYLPLYFIETGEENTKYVLDLQVCVITKDANFSTKVQDTHGGVPVQMKHKRRLWNIMKFIFLYGGNKYAFDWGATSLPERAQFELQEYTKFSNLPMQWVKLQDISISDKIKKEQIEQTMVPIVLEENSRDVSPLATAKESSQKPQFLVKEAPMPTKFQKRQTILHEIENYSSQPLW